MTKTAKRELSDRIDWLVGKLADPNGAKDARAAEWRKELNEKRMGFDSKGKPTEPWILALIERTTVIEIAPIAERVLSVREQAELDRQAERQAFINAPWK